MLTIFQATFHLYRKYCCSEITKPFLTDTGNKMALIKIRLNLLKSQKSTKIAFAYLCSSSGSFLSFDELAATWGIS